MVRVIFSICVNPIIIMPTADGFIPTCRENPILISSFEGRAEGSKVKIRHPKLAISAVEIYTRASLFIKTQNIFKILCLYKSLKTLSLWGRLAFVSINLKNKILHLLFTTVTNMVNKSNPSELWILISCSCVPAESDMSLWMLLEANSIWPIVCLHGWLPD